MNYLHRARDISKGEVNIGSVLLLDLENFSSVEMTREAYLEWHKGVEKDDRYILIKGYAYAEPKMILLKDAPKLGSRWISIYTTEFKNYNYVDKILSLSKEVEMDTDSLDSTLCAYLAISMSIKYFLPIQKWCIGTKYIQKVPYNPLKLDRKDCHSLALYFNLFLKENGWDSI